MKTSRLLNIILLFLVCLSAAGCDKERIIDYQYEDVFDCNLDSTKHYIAVIGDIQALTLSRENAYGLKRIMNWLEGMYRQNYLLDCVLQVGDLTQLNRHSEYQQFRSCTEDFGRHTPFIACVGNHDYEWDSDNWTIPDRGNTLYSEYASFTSTEYATSGRFRSQEKQNICVNCSIAGSLWKILVLEFAPRNEVLDWAERIIADNPDTRFIILTHEYLGANGDRLDDRNSYKAQFADGNSNSPETVWQRLVYTNDNVRCVVCGHNGFSQHRTDKNLYGREIPQVLFNIQYYNNGISGLVELWEIDPKMGRVDVKVYDTYANMVWKNDIDSVFCTRNTMFSFPLY